MSKMNQRQMNFQIQKLFRHQVKRYYRALQHGTPAELLKETERMIDVQSDVGKFFFPQKTLHASAETLREILEDM